MPLELLWIVVVFGVNFTLWGSIGALRFAQSAWQGRGSAAEAGPQTALAGSRRRPGGCKIAIQDVAVLIPAHNEEAVLARSLESIARLIARDNIYVVSDASTDRTVAIAADRGVSVIETAAKAGKAGALEEGIRRFQLVERYEAVLLLDADTQLDQHYFECALPLFDDAEVVAVAGSAHTDWNPPGVSLLGKVLITHRARIYAITQHLIKFGQTWRYTNALYIIPGFASMYRTRVLPHIDINPPGLVIEDFNMTFEVYRRQLGRVGFTPRARAVTQDPDTFEDYVRQTKRWALGFWQAVRRYRPRPGLFSAMLALYVTELIIASALIILLPVLVVLLILPAVIPGLLDTPVFDLIHTRMDLRILLIAVLLPDLLLTIAVAVSERRPRYLLFAPAFLLLRMVDAAIALYALPRAWAERSTGSWVSPQRRGAVTADNDQVAPSRLLPAPRRYAVTVNGTAVSYGSPDEAWQLDGTSFWAYSGSADTGIVDEGRVPGTAVARITARVPVPRTDAAPRALERRRAAARLTDVGADGGFATHAESMPSSAPGSSFAAIGAAPERVEGRARVRNGAAGSQSSPMRVTSGVVSGRVTAEVIEQLRKDARSALGSRGTTIIIAEAVESVVGFAARQIPGVHGAHTEVNCPAAAFVQEHGRNAPGVSTGGDGVVAEVRIALCIEYGFVVRTVTQDVRSSVILALRILLDVEAASVNIIVRDICPSHDNFPPAHSTG